MITTSCKCPGTTKMRDAVRQSCINSAIQQAHLNSSIRPTGKCSSYFDDVMKIQLCNYVTYLSWLSQPNPAIYTHAATAQNAIVNRTQIAPISPSIIYGYIDNRISKCKKSRLKGGGPKNSPATHVNSTADEPIFHSLPALPLDGQRPSQSPQKKSRQLFLQRFNTRASPPPP